jgi:hypothetical protein
MRTALELPPAALDERERSFLAVIREHGWFHTRVFDADGDEPAFSYTTGFSAAHGFPEIIVFDLPQEVTHSILWDLWRALAAGHPPGIGKRVTGIFGNAEAVLLPVARSAYAEHLGWNRWFYDGDAFDCLQLVWPDRTGKFPWEGGFDERFVPAQPDLTGANWRLGTA